MAPPRLERRVRAGQVLDRRVALSGARIACVGDLMVDRYVYGEVDRIAKAVPNQPGIKLSEALTMSPQLKELHVRVRLPGTRGYLDADAILAAARSAGPIL